MKTKITHTLLLFTVFFLVPITTLLAQVTIGSALPPATGTLLHLTQGDETTKGLGMPRVALTSLTDLYPMFTDEDGNPTQEYIDDKIANRDIDKSHIGLLVYNVKSDDASATNRMCPGLHVWDGDEWKPLKPYLEATEDRILKESVLIDYTFLDPNNPTDPKWGEFGKNASDYPLGVTDKFIDNRDGTPQEYYYTRYYVGYAKVKNIYTVVRNFSCDGNESAKTEVDEEFDGELFDDGIWMNQNMRATIMDPQRTVSFDTPINLIENSNMAQSWATAAWISPNHGLTNPNNYATDGILYTWAAVSNGKGGADGKGGSGGVAADEGGIKERGITQGICPIGWHLPSDREWTILENAMMINTSLFANGMTDIGSSNLLDYKSIVESVTGNPQSRGTTHGLAMRSPIQYSSVAVTGNSKGPDQGGIHLTAMGYGGLKVTNGMSQYGRYSRQWTSSSSNKGSYYREVYSFAGSATTVQRGCTERFWMHSVRCLRDQGK